MNYLLDTNHWSYIQRRHPAVLSHLQTLSNDAVLYMPVIAQAELLAGVELTVAGRRKDELRRLYEHVVGESAQILPVDSRVAEQFAATFARLHRAGRPIETNDIWIAAIAAVHDCIVVSNDAHFRSIEGLRVEDWTS
ncbi:MAG: PIN domain-containing protein [Phycisphaerales bacterium]|nr:PIN domain-containing protein [Phycisphaerales bacterium]